MELENHFWIEISVDAALLASFRNRSGEGGRAKEAKEEEEEERRKGARPCLAVESLTGILMCLNLCISSVCNPERGVGETEGKKGGWR